MEQTMLRPKTKNSRGGKYAQKHTSAKTKQAVAVHMRPRRRWYFWLIPAVAVAIVALLVIFMVDRGSSYTFQVSGKQFYADNSAQVAAGTELKLQEDGTVLLYRNGQGSPTNLPVYLDDSRSIVIPRDMVYYEPRTSFTGRVLHFSQVDCTENGAVTFTRQGKEMNYGQGFLFDGQDFYLFLEPVVVEFNGYRYELPTLSYVEAVYGSHVMLYNYDTGECIMEAPETVATAQPAAGDYVISMIADSMTMYDGSRRLLVSRPDVVDPIN